MATVTVHAGVCGFTTEINARSEDSQNVEIDFTSDCPNVVKAKNELGSVNAYNEIFKPLSETEVYETLSSHLPHVACPLYSGFLKAIEVAAGLALPKDASIRIEKDDADNG